MMKWNDVVINQFGGVVKGASVTVKNTGLQTSPTIYSDNGTSTVASSTVTADSLGRYSFYVAAGRYDLNISGAGITAYTESDILIFDPHDTSDGAAYLSFLQSGTGALAESVQTALRRFVWAEQYGAVGDGSTDCTTAFVNAITQSKHVMIGTGTFLVDTIALSASGIILEGSGVGKTIIKGRNSSATKILNIDGSSGFITDIVVRNMTLDMSNMTDANTRSALFMNYTYNNLIEKVNVTNVGSNKLSVNLAMQGAGQGVYTTRFIGCDLESSSGKINIAGISTADAITTITFDTCQYGRCTIDSAYAINFNGVTVQGALNKFVLSNAFNIDILGGDVEGTGTYLSIGANVSRILSINNNISSSLTYSSGTASWSWLQDRQGAFLAKANGAQPLTANFAGATTIYTFRDNSNVGAYSAALFVVIGDDGVRGWSDVVLVSVSNVAVISSNVMYGAGNPTRTYTYSAGNIQLALSAVAANTVRVLALEYMGST